MTPATSAAPPAAPRPRINTRKAPRRALRFTSLDDLEAELDRLQHAQHAGTLGATGNWSPGQVLKHLAAFWAAPIDGFPPSARFPAPLVFAAKLLFKRKAVSGATTPPGFKFPAGADLDPPTEITFDEGMAALRRQVARIRAGEEFSHPSPLFGRLTHDQWLRLQLGHCQLHLGFLNPEGASAT